MKTFSSTANSIWRREKETYLSVLEREALASEVRFRMLEMWRVNIAPLSGAFSIVELYVEFFLNQLDVNIYLLKENNFIRILPKATSALCLYQVLGFSGLIGKDKFKAPTKQNFPPVISRHSFGDLTPCKLGGNFDQAVGVALAEKINKKNTQVVVFIGDGELQIGLDHQAKFAACMHLNNLVLIVDCNKLQSDYFVSQVDHTLIEDESGNLAKLQKLWEIYGWCALEIDGHDFEQISNAFEQIGTTNRPLIIIAKTSKGKGVPFIENKLGFNHRLTDREYTQAHKILLDEALKYRQLGYQFDYKNDITSFIKSNTPITYKLPTRKSNIAINLEDVFKQWYEELIKLNANKVVIINTDNPRPFQPDTPTYSPGDPSFLIFAGSNELFALNCARGFATVGYLPTVISPATHIMINGEEWKLAALDFHKLLLVGRTPGSELARWGHTHLVYEDIERFQTYNAMIFQPATNHDVVLILEYVFQSQEIPSPIYLRLPRMDSVVVPKAKETCRPNHEAINHGFYIVRSFYTQANEIEANVILVASGQMVRECIIASEKLEKLRISNKVVNVINLTQLNPTQFRECCLDSQIIITVIDALPQSLSRIVLQALHPNDRHKVVELGITNPVFPACPPSQIYQSCGINASGIIEITLSEIGD